MRRERATRVLLLVALLLLAVTPSVGHAHSHVVVGIGPWWDPFWPYYYPYAYGSPYWWYAPYYAYPPPVIEEPPVYIQREPTPSAEQSLPAGFWYYCPSPSGPGYYPSVPMCPEPWIPVPPRASGS